MRTRTRFRAFKCRLGVHRLFTFRTTCYEARMCRDCPYIDRVTLSPHCADAMVWTSVSPRP